MSTTITELVPPRGSVTADKRAFERIFSVATDTALSVSGILELCNGTDMPAWGDPHPDEPAQTCKSITPVSDDGGYGYLVTFEYELGLAGLPVNANDVLDVNSQAYIGCGFPAGHFSSWAADDPCRKKWTFETGTERQSRDRLALVEVDDQNIFDPADTVDPNVNTAGDYMYGTVKEDVYIPVLHLTKNATDTFLAETPYRDITGSSHGGTGLTQQLAHSLVGSVNTMDLIVCGSRIPAFGAVMKTFQLKRSYWGRLATPYWEVRVEILCPFVSDPQNGALILVLQQGLKSKDEVDPITGASMPINKKNGTPISTPVFLDAAGKQLIVGGAVAPYYRRFLPSNRQDWSQIRLPQTI